MKHLAPQDRVKIQFAALIIALLLAVVGIMEGSTFFFVSSAHSQVIAEQLHSDWVLQYTATPFQKLQRGGAAEDLLTRIAKDYNRYGIERDEDQLLIENLYRLNVIHYGSNQWVTVSENLYEMLERSYQMTIDTRARYNMFIGAYVDAWFPYLLIGSGHPSELTLANAALCVPTIDQLIANPLLEFNSTLRQVKYHRLSTCPTNQRVGISLGGLAKGYAVDQIVELLGDLPDLFINGGSSSLFLGQLSTTTKTLGFFNPLFVDGTVTDIALREGLSAQVHSNTAVSTSGDYQQGYRFDVDGETVWFHHILNPVTGYPARYARSVTVFGPSATWADALSTALMAMSQDDGMQFLNEFSNEYDAYDVVWMMPSGSSLQIYHRQASNLTALTSPYSITVVNS